MHRDMRHTALYLAMSVALCLLSTAPAAAQTKSYKGPDFDITAASVTYVGEMDLLVFEQQVAGSAGATTPTAHGQLDGAPVLGHVFPTSLKPTDVGFGATEGIVALVQRSRKPDAAYYVDYRGEPMRF